MTTPNSANPYYNLTAVRSFDMFFGRTKLLTRLYQALANRQSVSLVGPPGIGKSSVLYWVSQPEMQERYSVDLSRNVFVLLDMSAYIYKTGEEFFDHVCEEIKRQARRHKLSLRVEGQGSDEFSDLLNHLNEQGFYPVLLMDAFDNVSLNTHLEGEFFTFLRAHATFGKISYVTASMASLSEIIIRITVDSPFANIFHTFRLGNFSEQEAHELISIPAQRAEKPFTSEEVAWAREVAGLHPLFIQRVCYALFEEKQRFPDGKVELQDVRKKVFDSLLPHFTDIWQHLTDAEHAALHQETQSQNHGPQKFPELSESALFRRFVREIGFRNMPLSINEQEVEDALDKIDNLVALGETKLQYLKAVTQHLNKDVPSSAAEKGRIIREILNEALKQLQGSGDRSDDASEWMLYNILFYRYFRHHLKNEQTAYRLGMSVRHYYRTRNKAIKALLNILLEMDQQASS